MHVSNIVAVSGDCTKANGCIALWGQCAPIGISRLDAAAGIVGVQPNAIGPRTSLRRALAALSDANAYQEDVSSNTIAVLSNVLELDATFSLRELCRAKVVTGVAEPYVELIHGTGRYTNEALQDAYRKALQTYTASDVGVWCSKYVIPSLRGVALRDRGGVYLIPTSRVGTWQAFADALTATGATSCHSIPVAYGPRLAQLAIESVRDHVQAELTAIRDAVLAGQLGAKALQGRIDHGTTDLEQTVRAYADLLGETQQALLADVEEVRQCIEAALIMQEAASIRAKAGNQ